MTRLTFIFLSFCTLLFLPFSSAFALSCTKTAGYKVSKKNVTYHINSPQSQQVIAMPKADPSSFKPFISKIGHWPACVLSYAHDNNHAYYQGKPIAGVNGGKFRRLSAPDIGANWFSDGKNLIFNGKVIGSTSDKITKLGGGYFTIGHKTFYQAIKLPTPLLKVLKSGGYGISKQAVYYQGKPTHYDPKTFQLVGGQYFRDKNGVYCQNSGKILDADPVTFIVHKKAAALAADKNGFYYECRPIKTVNDSYYMDIFAHGILRDANAVYFIDSPIKRLDAGSVVVHFQGGRYIQDKNGVYYIRKKDFLQRTLSFNKIKDAHLATFQATGLKKGRDTLSLYQEDKRLGDNWDGLKHQPKAFFRVKRKRLYRLSMPQPFVNNFNH